MIRTLLSAAVALFTLSSQIARAEDAPLTGEAFKTKLVNTLEGASKVVVTEHSWSLDLPDLKEEFVYKTLELSKEQKAKLITELRAMKAEPLEKGSRCEEPHHSLIITDAAGKEEQLSVCFSCKVVSWHGRTQPPQDFLPTFQEFIEGEGFHASRDWKELATNAQAAAKPEK